MNIDPKSVWPRNRGGEALIAAQAPLIPPPEFVDSLRSDSLQPGQYKHDAITAAGGDSVVSRLQAAHRTYSDGWNALAAAMKGPRDPSKTEEAHLISLRHKADMLVNSAGSRGDTATALAKEVLADIGKQINEKIGSPPPYAGEIRSYLRSLSKPSERHSTVLRAAEEGDTATLAAVLKGPAYLSGLTEEQIEVARSTFLKKHAGDLLARKRAIEKALQINFDASNDLFLNVEKLFDRKTLTAIAKQAEAANAASAAIDKAIG